MNKEYITIPKTISYTELSKEKSLSPSNYQKLFLKNKNVKLLNDLISHPLTGGKEIGSNKYIKKSTHYFIRTKAISKESYIINYDSKGITPILPQAFIDNELKEGDIIIAKDSKIGEVVIIDRDLPTYMLSGGFKKLDVLENKYYVFAVLKSDFFKKQLNILISKGATIRHAKTKFLDCVIPFPNQKNDDELFKYITALVKTIIKKENEIQKKNKKINDIIEQELLENQKNNTFHYHYPSYDEINEFGRIDTGLYSYNFKERTFLIDNYKYGAENIEKWGFEPSRGQNLQLTSIGKSIYSDVRKTNFYKLFLPTNLTSYGTVSKIIYLGNKNKLKCLEKGDIIFGAEGFQKGRTIVVPSELEKTITNIHGIVFKSSKQDLTESIFIRCFINYLRDKGLIDSFAVGGNGGSMAQKYWNIINFPKFHESIQKKISELYYNPIDCKEHFSINDFEEKNENISDISGILQLDYQIKIIQEKLDYMLYQIINDKEIEVDFEFYNQAFT